MDRMLLTYLYWWTEYYWHLCGNRQNVTDWYLYWRTECYWHLCGKRQCYWLIFVVTCGMLLTGICTDGQNVTDLFLW